MSKIIDMLSLKKGDKKIPSRHITTNIVAHTGIDSPYSIRYNLKLSARVEASAWIEEGNSDEYECAIQDMKISIAEEVFGEFRPILAEMRLALYDEDKVRMRLLITEMEARMFMSI